MNSAASIADGVEKVIRDSVHEISYVEEELKSLLFQDDISRISDSVEAAQNAYELVYHVMENKVLDFNHDKSCFLVVGKTCFKKEIKKNLQLALSGFLMKKVLQEKY